MSELFPDEYKAVKSFERAILRRVTSPKEGLCDSAKYALLYHISEFPVWRYSSQGSGLLDKSVIYAALVRDAMRDRDARNVAPENVGRFHCEIDRSGDELRVYLGRELIAAADIKNFSEKYYWRH